MARSQRAQAAPGTATKDFQYRATGDLVAALAQRKISATELLEQSISRIAALDGRINAVVVHDFERARAAAAAADAALARGEQRPLLGVPITVKEAFNVAGLPTTWGAPQFKDFAPPADAVAVARLKAAGAVILGKTNVPIWLMDWQSYNDIYGTTNNPWDLNRTPGGSSGGAAAALAAGYVSLELGSDIGGSLRAPAHYCGVFSHKPSHGLLPSRGHTPPGVTPLPREVDLAVIGPLARTASDLALALDVLAGPDEAEGVPYRLALPPPRHDDLKSFRVLVVDEHPLLPTAASVQGAIDRLADRLGKAGATVARSSPHLPNLAKAARIYMTLLTSIIGADWPIDQYRRLGQIMASVPEGADDLDTLRGRGVVLSHRDWISTDRLRGGMQQQWRDLFREWDVVLCPPMPTPAFPHDHSPDQRTRHISIDGTDHPYQDQLVWPGVATMPGLPATTMPLERTADGLPVGVQIVGPYFEDRTPIAFAGLVEREFGGFVAPPLGL
ncbi:MAG TPA: amidase [Xanthobacteraceae bacterium]|nr:amidase [Xanthobacteraceae bacterium]